MTLVLLNERWLFFNYHKYKYIEGYFACLRSFELWFVQFLRNSIDFTVGDVQLLKINGF